MQQDPTTPEAGVSVSAPEVGRIGNPSHEPAPVIECPMREPPALDLGEAPKGRDEGAQGIVLRLVDDLRAQVSALREEVQRAQALADRLHDSEEERAQDRRTREALFEKLDASRPQFQLQLLRPMVQRMATLFDLANDWARQPPADTAGFARCLDLFASQFKEVLQLHGIDVVAPRRDEPFDRRFHHVVSTQPTSDAGRHERVASLIQHGFLYYGQNDRSGSLTPSVIRPARVVLYKHDPALAAEARNDKQENNQ